MRTDQQFWGLFVVLIAFMLLVIFAGVTFEIDRASSSGQSCYGWPLTPTTFGPCLNPWLDWQVAFSFLILVPPLILLGAYYMKRGKKVKI
jgi:hypothetical protein